MSEQRARRPKSLIIVVGVVLAVPLLLWIAPLIASWVGAISLAEVDHLYLVIAGFVVFDAVIPVFPSESLLTSASTIAAQPGSDIAIWRLSLAGTAGAVVGDSLLYWLARTVMRRTMAERVERAGENPKVARAVEVLDSAATTLIVFGRFVPGLRFVIGASMGLTRYPYGRFLMYSSIGAAFWATYTCVFSYLVATVIDDMPLVSFATSVVVTTALLGFLYIPLKRSIEASGEQARAERTETV